MGPQTAAWQPRPRGDPGGWGSWTGAFSGVAWGMFEVGTQGKSWLAVPGAAGVQLWDVQAQHVCTLPTLTPATSSPLMRAQES